MTPRRILLVRIGALGDIAMTSGLLERVRHEWPDAHVTWLCGESVAGLVQVLGPDEVITVNDRALLAGSPWARLRALAAAWRRLALRRFDDTFLVHPDPRYRALLVPVRRGRLHALRRTIPRSGSAPPGRYMGDEYERLVDASEAPGPRTRRFGIANVRPRLEGIAPIVSRTGTERVVAIAPGGARNIMRDSPLRRWPVESYVHVAGALGADGVRVVLVGGSDDAWVRDAFDGLAVEDFIGRLDVRGSLALLRDVDLVISHDTGPLHLARLVRAPLLALFGPTMPSQFITEDTTTTVFWGGADLACRPCYDGREFAACANNRCMQSISPAAVLDAARRILSGASSSAIEDGSVTIRSGAGRPPGSFQTR